MNQNMETFSASTADGKTSSFSMEMISNNPLLSAHISGASPTTYFCGQMVLKQLIQKGGLPYETMAASENNPKSQQQENEAPSVGKVDRITGYAPLHYGAFMEANSYNFLLETASVKDLNIQDSNGNTPLIWAAAEGREEIAQLLVDAGAEVNLQNFSGETALILAASKGYNGICYLLIENGANINIATLDGVTASHYAASNGHLDVLVTLVNHGAHLNAQDDEGDTPLHYAVRESNDKIVHFLVEQCHVQLELENNDQESPLQLASCLEETKLVQYLTSASLQRGFFEGYSGAIPSESNPNVVGFSLNLEEDDEQEGSWAHTQVQGNFESYSNSYWKNTTSQRPCSNSTNEAAQTVWVRM